VAERYDKSGKDPLALQDEMTTKIVGAIAADAGMVKKAQYQAAWGKDTADLGEYDYYLRSHNIITTASSKAELDRAGPLLSEGLAKYPDSYLIKVQLAWYHFAAAWSLWSDDIQGDYRKAGQLVREVLAGENLSPQAKRLGHWLFAWVLASEHDFGRALNEADTAVALAPYDGDVYGNLAQLALRLRGKYEDSVAAFKQSFYPDGDTPINIAIALVRLGRIDEAKAEVKAYLQKTDPKFAGAKWRQAWFYSDPSIMDAEVADLAKAGLPEK
jgi:adenylate cyclase